MRSGHANRLSATGGSSGLGDLSQFGLGGLGASTDLTSSLRDLYKQMGETQDGFPPLMFLNAFRTAYPQFGERSRDGKSFAQQDAEEAWSQIVTTLKQKLLRKPDNNDDEADTGKRPAIGFVDEIMGGKFQKIEECKDAAATEAGEKPTQKTDEVFYKLNCHVASKDILHLREGIAAALEDTYTKTSPTLNREAEYVTKSCISRLPRYLPVHFVRFYWKRDVNKKAKILRKVTFPHELDCVEYCTDELKSMLIPVRDKIRDVRKEELDVDRARKRQKRMKKEDEDPTDASASDKSKKPASANKSGASSSNQTDGKGKDTGMKDGEEEVYKTDAQIEEERAASILALKKALLEAVNPTLAADKGANQTGLYELRGVITHQGASADSGHYTAYVKKDPQMKTNPTTGKKELESDEKWWWFNDDKVSEVEADKIEALAGGGESHSALILLYKAVELPQLTEKEQAQAS